MSNIPKKKILAVGEDSIFMLRDLQILREHFDVRTIATRPKRMKRIAKSLVILRILKGTLWADLTFSWFANYAALLAVLFSKMLRKKSIVIVGGFEVAKVPEIEYGAMLRLLDSSIAKFVLKHADCVLTVDESLRNDAIINANVNGRNIKTVPTGYDLDVWISKGDKENVVITTAQINWSTVKRKGLDTFVVAAKYLPDIKFILVGPHVDGSIDHLRKLASPNVEFPGFVPNEELAPWYSRAKVYCQLSRYEGLPNALCEAMLCECVPVGTKYCGIPSAMGDTGFYVPYGDVNATVEAIRNALISDKGKEARERIRILFPWERRKKELVAEIMNTLGC